MDKPTPADKALRELVTGFGSQKDAAKALGISEPYLSDLLKRRRAMSVKILNKLGFRRTIVAK